MRTSTGGPTRKTLSRPGTSRASRKNRRGFFLILTLVVIVLATMAAYSFTDLMLAYDEAAILNTDRSQAEMLVESGVEATRLILSQPRAMRADMGGVFSNQAMFQAANVLPGMDASERGNFTIVAPALDETGAFSGIRFGLQNESARLNLNVLPTLEASGDALGAVSALAGEMMGDAIDQESTDTDNLARSLLMALPGMTEETADCILDFIDEDDEPRDYGAESEHYLSLASPYEPKNGPLDSVEELLLVKGVTPYMLFGADANRNGVVDPSEQQTSTMITAGEPSMALGWSAFLTVYSLENNKRDDGTPRINVNSDDLETLFTDLTYALGNEDWASFIVAYRIAGQPSAGVTSMLGGELSGGGSVSGGGYGGGSSDGGSGGGSGSGDSGSGGGQSTEMWTAAQFASMDMSGGGGTKLNQILDLVGATVEVDGITYMSPFIEGPIAMALYMPALMGNVTTQDFTTMPGRLNINECPAELIRGIPLISEEAAEAIIEARGQQSDTENRQFETWPLVEGLITLDEMKLLMPIMTAAGDVYRAQIIGYFEGKNLSSRSEVIIDATSVNPKVIYWRDLSHLGRGFDKAVLGLRAADAFEDTMSSALD
jgi:type II secretory pathway component PulK